MISKESYKDLKEYWDYQRKIQYNRETVFDMADQMKHRAFNEFGPMSVEQIRNHLWDRVDPDHYEDAPKEWIPKDESYRFEWEPEPKKSVKSKGRPVVLRAKDSKEWQEAFEELDNANRTL